ncbi:G5 domain-containing protein [Actinoplanes sp. KI2]|uniref:G5 domain-containing protein n=1 Tax=Actinoplanes sp. KI2 TaxID=2983315 RepID=UPI0021D5FCBB|nr:G5 domain-containing protein [Actinoplanes sp. KI2]MCU7726661.1 G5 domain-containing protein [Actinoplanes sp. KI2]
MQNQTSSDSWQQLLEMPRKSWWARLPFGVRMASGASAVLVVLGAGVAGVATLVEGGGGRAPGPRIVTEPNGAAPAAGGTGVATGTGTADGADLATGTAAGTILVPVPAGEAAASKLRADKQHPMPKNQQKANPGINAAAPPKSAVIGGPAPVAGGAVQPVQTTRVETETREIPYETRTVRDPGLPRGTRQIETPGVNGLETLRYLVTLTDGRPTDRRLIATVVTRRPQFQVVSLGTQRPVRRPVQGPQRPATDNNRPAPNRPVRNCGLILNLCLPFVGNPLCSDGGHEEAASIPPPDPVADAEDLGYLDAADAEDIGYLEGLVC